MPRRVSARAIREERGRRAWAALRGSIADRLAIATDPYASGEELATIAPPLYDRDPDPELVFAVLAHPNVPAGVVSRYATVNDPRIRLAVAQHPLCPSTSLVLLKQDRDPQISQTAAEAYERLAP